MFFFYFDETNSEKIIKTCLTAYFDYKLTNSNYCDVSDLFEKRNKADLKKSVTLKDKSISKLLDKKYPKEIKDLNELSMIKDHLSNTMVDYDIAFAILYWSFKVFNTNNVSFENNKSEIMKEFVDYLNSNYENGFNYVESTIYKTSKVKPYLINSVNEFLITLKDIKVDKNCFYRGHSNIAYNLLPSLMRNPNIFKCEKEIYQELIVCCPNEFSAYKNRIDYLVKMQHYGLPTRLLDITKNPLVALYFACCSNNDCLGEVQVFNVEKNKVKNYYSDAVAMLSTLPLLTQEEQYELMDKLYYRQKDTSIIDKFVDMMKEEKPSFVDRINASDVENCFVVMPKKENDRIIKQDGAFFICGVNNSPQNKINEKRHKHNDLMPLLCITNKQSILEELDSLSINKSTLFPEIDNVAEYIKEKYN